MIDKNIIEEKKKILEACKTRLKEDFIGIDRIIDNLMDYIQVWYLMPELLYRPVIVNLWGMTGVGKTDLIRKMVKYLDFQEKFVEVELSNSDQTSYDKSVAEILLKNDLNGDQQGIVLFDEIQRFNTIDETGAPIPQTKFMDFWELLSDGRLSRKSKDDLESTMMNLLFRKKDNEKRRLQNPDQTDDYNFLGYWEARELKKSLGIEADVVDLAEMSEEEVAGLIMASRKRKKIYEPIDYSKLLIIISGNLDEAYTMARQTSESDVDANIFSAFTEKITFVDVKNALNRKFRPEQVARFGNIHLIYNSLLKADFEKLIAKEISKRIEDTKAKFGINLTIDQSINRLIYSNGVFPVQGVRPVFSSIIDILDANLSKMLFRAIMSEEKSIAITYDEISKNIIAEIGKETLKIPYVGRIDKIRENNKQDAVANISVHESGHAVAYMALTGLVPLQLKSKIASSHAGGFTFPHDVHETKSSLLNKVKIFLAGGIAEELVFGKENATTGRSSDWESATMIVLNYLRAFGFNDEYLAVYNLDEYRFRMNQAITDEVAEKLIKKMSEETRELLQNHKDLLIDLSSALANSGNLNPGEMAKIAAEHGIKVEAKEEAYLYIPKYSEMLHALGKR